MSQIILDQKIDTHWHTDQKLQKLQSYTSSSKETGACVDMTLTGFFLLRPLEVNLKAVLSDFEEVG